MHRLDRDTSGCLLVAKRRAALRDLHAQLREGTTEKLYLALVCGTWNLGQQAHRAARWRPTSGAAASATWRCAATARSR